tara:strand:+ start:809 stop:1186 length:378 start_codon:yes stop_codon:yes gene_type:complete
MTIDHKVLKAHHIEFPEYHQVYHLGQLGNYIDYDTRNMESDARFRLKCLCTDLDTEGMQHPIIISYNGYEVSVGHQRVWYAKQKGYTHIDCYHIPNQAAWEKVFHYTQSNDYWKKYTQSEKHKLS